MNEETSRAGTVGLGCVRVACSANYSSNCSALVIFHNKYANLNERWMDGWTGGCGGVE